jgi:hypothetical protein
MSLDRGFPSSVRNPGARSLIAESPAVGSAPTGTGNSEPTEPNLVQERRRPFDVAEEQGDSAGRELPSHSAIIRPA